MTEAPTLEQIIDVLDDSRQYIAFLVGDDQYSGSFRIDRSPGSEIKHHHFLFEAYHTAEIYPLADDGDEEQQRAALGSTLHRVEHAIKEHYYRRLGDRGMKNGTFLVIRVSDDGEYLRGLLDGETLSRDLKTLISGSRTLTIIEKGSRADHLFGQTLSGSGRVRLHPGECHLSEMTDEEREQYLLGDSEADDDELVDNLVEHHPD
jgi:hypothetical protein